MRQFLASFAFLLLATRSPAQMAPKDAVAFQPTAELANWWRAAVIACDCQPAAHLGDVAWYVVPSGDFRCAEAETGLCWGYWFKQGEDNYIFLSPLAKRTRLEVQHEMLHALLGTSDHGDRFRRALDRLR